MIKKISQKIFELLVKTVKVKGENNQYDANLAVRTLKVNGSNNIIEIDKSANVKKLRLKIQGSNHKIVIGKNTRIAGKIYIGFENNYCNNCTITIGDETTAQNFCITMLEPDTAVEIGEDCMFSYGVDIWASDTHSVTDLDGNLLNYGNKVFIGKHCWVGKDVKIGKHAHISDNSVVSWGSVVYRKFLEPNVVIMGNPADVVKKGINWDRRSPHNYKLSLVNKENTTCKSKL